ncbi:MAG: ion transporter [Actinobacteria bacterium]|nr:ion transporter [Actinomycetota bacterium]
MAETSGIAAGGLSADERESRLAQVSERLDPFMAWLGVIFALLVGYEIAVELSPRASRVLLVAGWAIWAIFVAEFLLRLAIAPSRPRFLRRNWVQLVALIVPTLRVFSFLRLLRLGRALPAARVASASYRSLGTARRVARSRIGYIGALSTVVTIGIAELAYLFERDADDGAFDGFGDALLWSAAAVFGQQADPVPESVGGRIAMIVAFVLGVGVVASLAATLGAWFVDERHERAEDAVAPEPPLPR